MPLTRLHVSKTGHEHFMTPIAWTLRDEGSMRDGMDEPGSFAPAVLFGCTRGVCAQTRVIAPRKRQRKVPVGLTKTQFRAMQGGTYWNELQDGV